MKKEFLLKAFLAGLMSIMLANIAIACPPPPPTAILNISPDPAAAGQSVLLDGSSSIAGSGYINLYQWDFTNNGSYDYYETPTYHPDGAFDGKTTHVYSTANT